MNLAIRQPNQQLHEILKNGYIEVGDFLEQIAFLYRNVPNKELYYIKMMNKYFITFLFYKKQTFLFINIINTEEI